MGNYLKQRVITEDGEIIGEKIVSYYNPFKDGVGYNFKYKSINIRSYLGITLPKCFNDSEVGKIYRLSRLIYSDSNLLAKRSNNTIRPLTKQEIQEIVGLHRTKFNPFWNKVLENKIIKQIRLDGMDFYCFNPLYFNSTRYLPLYLYIAFQDELQGHLPKWVIEKYLDMMEGEKGQKNE